MPVLSSVWVPAVLFSDLSSVLPQQCPTTVLQYCQAQFSVLPHHCPQYCPSVLSIISVLPCTVLDPLSSAPGQARSRLSCPGRLRPPLRPAASPGWPATGGLVAVLRPRLAVSVQDNNNNSVTMHHVACCLHPAPGTSPGHLATTGYTGAGAGPGPAWENSTLPKTGQIWNTDNLVVEEIEL